MVLFALEWLLAGPSYVRSGSIQARQRKGDRTFAV